MRSVHLQALAADFLDDGNSIRSAQNYLAHVRFLLRKSGRAELLKHPHTSNSSLGISGADRSGVRDPLEESTMVEFARQAGALEPGVACVIELGYFMGLRVQEGVMAGPDLARWEDVLRHATSDMPELRVSRGTKGGRMRQVAIFDVAGTLKAIARAREVARSRGGCLIPGGLPQAIARVYTVCSGIGMTGVGICTRKNGPSARLWQRQRMPWGMARSVRTGCGQFMAKRCAICGGATGN